jgi:DNA-binding LacI/PurR family transcriptional regulator
VASHPADERQRLAVTVPLLVNSEQGGAMARVTLQTIADRVGVSRMTVSNAFSRPDQLSGALRERIFAVADELGYVGPDPTGRALARGTAGTVGVLLTDSLQYAFTDEVATSFLSAVVQGLAPTGLALTLLTTDAREDVIPARDVAMDGALIYSCRADSAGRDWLVRRRLPLVFVDQDPMTGFASVNVDDRGGAGAAAQHLVELGHRRVGILTVAIQEPAGFVDDPFPTGAGHPQIQRMLGWMDALQAAGIEPTVVQTPSAYDDADTATRSLLTLDEPPTAVLCFSDVLALEVIRVARSLGLTVPGDLSVVGFDDNPVARRSDPPLTTVHQDVTTKGRLAADALTATIAASRSGGEARVRHHMLPTELVVRASTGPAPTGRR